MLWIFHCCFTCINAMICKDFMVLCMYFVMIRFFQVSHLLSWRKLKRLQYPRFHCLDKRDSVCNNIIPFRIMPGWLSATLPVSHAFVTPDVVDGVQLTKLSKKSGIGNVRSHIWSKLNTLSPIVTPIIHRARLQWIRSDIIYVISHPLIWTWPEWEGLC